MKKYLFLISLLFSTVAVITALRGIDITPGAFGLAAWLIGIFVLKEVTRSRDIFTWVLSSFVLFYSIDPIHYGLPWFLSAGAGMLFVFLPRILFLSRISFLKMVWVDSLSGFIVLGFYIMGNLCSQIGWQGWAFPAFPVLYTLFRSFGVFMDYRAVSSSAGKKYKAEIGKEAPEFCLRDENGNDVRLSDFKNTCSVLVIFVRGDWCPTCHITLRAYERNREKFLKGNVTIVSIGPDPIGVNREMVEKLGVKFHILADDKNEAGMSYGIQTHDNNPFAKYEAGIPLPACFLICSKGIVRFTSRADHPGEIFNPEDIFPVIAKIAS